MREVGAENATDNSSINSFASSYHKIRSVPKIPLTDKPALPPLNAALFLHAALNVNPLAHHLRTHPKDSAPIFTLPAWPKFRNEVRVLLKKAFSERLKEIHSGNLLTLNPGDSLHVRTDYFCLSPHPVYTALIPLQKCGMSSGAIAVGEAGLKWEGEGGEEELLERLQGKEMAWEYAALEEGDMVLIGRDCIYGTFRNDSGEVKHLVEMRWVKSESSSSSSNSSS